MSAGKVNTYDVAVIGAGPAGSSAALALAQTGHTVVLLENARFPRYKTCGGGVLARAFKRLPTGAERIVERSFPSVALNFLESGRRFIAHRPEPIVYLTMRAELDQLLAQAAQTAGADFWEAHPVTAIQEHRDDVDILAKGKEIRAKFVIAADGVHSATAKAGGWPPLPVLAPALEYELQLAPEDFARYAELPRFDFDAIKAGYAWVFPKRQHLSVGVLSTRRTCPDLPTRLADYLRRLGITRVQKTERHGYLIPLAPRPGPLARGRILLAGDAAGLVDPVTAEGISHAIFSGQLAAQALVESRLDSTTAGSRYQALLEDKILGELRAARFLARILYHHPRIRNGVFRLNGQRLCDFVTQVITGESSYLGALKRPASYFKVLGW